MPRQKLGYQRKFANRPESPSTDSSKYHGLRQGTPASWGGQTDAAEPEHPNTLIAKPGDVLDMQCRIGNQATMRRLSLLKCSNANTALSASIQRDPSKLVNGNDAKVDPEVAKAFAMESIVGFHGLRPGMNVTNWVKTKVLPRHKEDSTFTMTDVNNLANWLTNSYIPIWDLGDYDTVLANLAGLGGNQLYIQHLQNLQWPGGNKPKVLGGKTVTTGNFVASSFIIRIRYTLTPDEILDTLLFEIQNAFQVSEFKQAQQTFLPSGPRKQPEKYGFAVAEIEYESDRRYVEELKIIYHAGDLGQLLVQLNVPNQYQTLQDYDESKGLDGNKVILPDRSILSTQAQRQALWWFKTQNWKDEDRKLSWIAANHGDNVASTSDLYKSQSGRGKKVGML